MPHSFCSVGVHLVFSTKNRKQFIVPSLKPRVYGYMASIIRESGAQCFIINGMADHVHLLLKAHSSVSIGELVRTVKCNSTRWIKETQRFPGFEWQSGYGAFGVCESKLKVVEAYIDTQEDKKQSFADEFGMFLKAHNVPFAPRYIWS